MSGLALTIPTPSATYKPQLTQMADRARTLGSDISKNVARILRALQIGDISRQRAEHVQAGLVILDGLDPSAIQVRLRAAGEMLLAAQLESALLAYNQAVSTLLPSIEGLAVDALALAALSVALIELGDSGDDVRDLKHRIDAAVQLVAEIQAADGAARYLAGRLENEPGTIAGTNAAQSPAGRHPLAQKASAFLDRIAYLEAAADDCIVILERLNAASDALVTDAPVSAQASTGSLESQKELAAAAAGRIKAILNKAEDDVAAYAGTHTDRVRPFDRGADPATSDESDDGLDLAGYAGLDFSSPDLGSGDDAFSGQLSVLLSKFERLYAMGQERDVHRAFSKACGIEVAEDTNTTDDDLF
jgi:hypothetical protein